MAEQTRENAPRIGQTGILVEFICGINAELDGIGDGPEDDAAADGFGALGTAWAGEPEDGGGEGGGGWCGRRWHGGGLARTILPSARVQRARSGAAAGAGAGRQRGEPQRPWNPLAEMFG